MGGVIGEKVGMGRDGPELDPPESTNPATGLPLLMTRMMSAANGISDHVHFKAPIVIATIILKIYSTILFYTYIIYKYQLLKKMQSSQPNT